MKKVLLKILIGFNFLLFSNLVCSQATKVIDVLSHQIDYKKLQFKNLDDIAYSDKLSYFEDIKDSSFAPPQGQRSYFFEMDSTRNINMSIRLDSINSFEFTGVSSNGVTYLICAEKNGEKLWFFKGLFFFIEATNKLFLLKYYHYPEIYGSISGDITYFFENIHLKGLGNIDGIYSLDKNFNVCRKLQFIENRMAFSSSFFYNEQNKLTEYVYFPTELYEKDVTKLNEITLNSLEVALSEKGQRYTFVFKIKGNPDYHDFVWNYFYDFRPFMLD